MTLIDEVSPSPDSQQSKGGLSGAKLLFALEIVEPDCQPTFSKLFGGLLEITNSIRFADSVLKAKSAGKGLPISEL